MSSLSIATGFHEELIGNFATPYLEKVHHFQKLDATGRGEIDVDVDVSLVYTIPSTSHAMGESERKIAVRVATSVLPDKDGFSIAELNFSGGYSLVLKDFVLPHKSRESGKYMVLRDSNMKCVCAIPLETPLQALQDGASVVLEGEYCSDSGVSTYRAQWTAVENAIVGDRAVHRSMTLSAALRNAEVIDLILQAGGISYRRAENM